MATYALPSVEENEDRPRRYREWLKRLPTWQLEIWRACPQSDEADAMVADELKAREGP